MQAQASVYNARTQQWLQDAHELGMKPWEDSCHKVSLTLREESQFQCDQFPWDVRVMAVGTYILTRSVWCGVRKVDDLQATMRWFVRHVRSRATLMDPYVAFNLLCGIWGVRTHSVLYVGSLDTMRVEYDGMSVLLVLMNRHSLYTHVVRVAASLLASFASCETNALAAHTMLESWMEEDNVLLDARHATSLETHGRHGLLADGGLWKHTLPEHYLGTSLVDRPFFHIPLLPVRMRVCVCVYACVCV